MEAMPNINSMSKTEKWIWIILTILLTGADVITQVSGIEGLKLPAIVINAGQIMAVTGRILYLKFFPKK